MTNEEVRNALEQLSEALVLADTTDLPALAGLHTRFEQLQGWARETGEARLAAATKKAADLIEAVILDEVENAPAAIDLIGETVAALQSVVRDGRSAAEVDFPVELGLDVETKTEETSGEDSASQVSQGSTGATLPPHIDEGIFSDFLERQESVLEKIESLVLSLEKSPDTAALGELKRILHTLKGEAGMLGLQDVERLCHATEEMLKHTAPNRAVESLLAVKDWLHQAFDCYAGAPTSPSPVEGVIKALETLPSSSEEPLPQVPPEDEQPAASDDEAPVYLEGDPDILAEFISEANDHLDASDVHLLTLESDPQNEDALNAVFRAFHTIKGVAGFLALSEIQTLSHEAESLLDRARKGELLLAGAAIDVTFDAVDVMKRLVGYVEHSLSTGDPLEREGALGQLMARIKAVLSGDIPPEQAEASGKGVDPAGKLGEILVESGAVTEEAVDDALQKQHEPPTLEKIGEMLVAANIASHKDIETALARQAADPDGLKIGEILVDMGVATAEKIEAALGKQKEPPRQKKLGKILVKEHAAAAKDVAKAIRSQKAARQRQETIQVREMLKIDAERLDRLVDTIGELVIAESMVSQSISSGDVRSAGLSRQLSQLNKITRELQEMSMGLRMVPVKTTFQKMARIARDAAKKLGKKLDFRMSGEDTEIDKTLVDRIGDPLVHMVRNAVDHGIEVAEDRIAAGKPEAGRVELRAFHRGGNIYIEIEDDGKGLDREKIPAKARERGATSDGDQMSDREVFNLIFEPGFSTVEKVTDMSGRGVGMDVVRRNIEALHGQVEIRSELGKGSIFSMRLPLTLAVIDGMVVSVGGERYIIPVLSIVTLLRPQEADIATVLSRGEVLSLQGELVALFRLHNLFGIRDAQEDLTKASIVVVEDEGRRTGLVVDEILGQQQIVIKSLGGMMRGVTGVSGASIMPDGRVGLILDVSGMVKLASSREADGVLPEAVVGV